jgi:hypothetical protein
MDHHDDEVSELKNHISPRSASSRPQHDSIGEDMWTGLNEVDVNDTLSPPPMNELIHRAISIFEKYLRQVITTRQAKIREIMISFHDGDENSSIISTSTTTTPARGGHIINQEHTPRDVFQDSISRGIAKNIEAEGMVLDSSVRDELQDLVSTIASKYNDVFYHNFEHAAHVMASADCLLSMLQNATIETHGHGELKTGKAPNAHPTAAERINHRDQKLSTYGIASCPITHLALVYSALVHDMEHEGVGNKQMVKEKHPLAIKYKGKSVAENNSLDIAIDLLEQNNYANLRKAIFGDFTHASSEAKDFMKAQEHIFYNILIENIQATDIFSRERLERNRRKWIESFDKIKHRKSHRDDSCTCESQSSKIFSRRASVPPTSKPTPVTTLTRLRSPSVYGEQCSKYCPSCQIYHDECILQLDHMKACAVIVQMIQAADVAHSMQSWSIFLKWNMKLYKELWAAKLVGRGPNFSETWFKEQLSFFDNYVTSVAKRLQQCGVFGDYGSLLLQNLRHNRAKWLVEGKDVCEQMRKRVTAEQGDEIKQG